jgi:predicted transcriptional regulator
MMQQAICNHVSSRRLRPQAEITRAMIMSLIQSQPGIRYSELVRITRLAHGTLIHNIKILERQRRIRIKIEDVRAFFLVAMTIDWLMP